jgi:hypothetical protein
MTREERDAVLDILNRVAPEWPATCDHSPEEYRREFCNVTFTLPNGWRIEVFKDGFGFGDWDYIDQIHAPDGRSWEYPFGESDYPNDDDPEREVKLADRRLVNWAPNNSKYRGGWEPYRP